MPTKKSEVTMTISAPNFQVAEFAIRGTAPHVQNKFSEKAKATIRGKQAEGSTAKKGRKLEPRNFEAAYEGSIHRSVEGWAGIPAPAFRNAMIEACRMVGFAMTRAKMSVFVLADGFDADDGTPLVKFTKGEPHQVEHMARLADGSTSITVRAMWDDGWQSMVRVRFDADQFTLQDVANLLMRAGMQVGVGEGRPFSKKSAGMGWGTFEVLSEENG